MIAVLAFWLILIALAIKILWNISLPYVLAVRYQHTNPANGPSGISVMPLVEWCLWAIVVVITYASRSDPPMSARTVGLLGAAAIGASYAHFFIASAVLGAILRRRRP